MINIVSTKHDHNGEPFRASVHKDLLCAYSAHYSAVLERRSSEDKEDAIKMDLPWCRMQNLVGWLYTGTMAWDDLDELLELYVFADQTKILALRRFIMSKIIQDYDLDCEDSMPYLERLSHSCGLFRYLVDLWAGKWSQMIDHPYQIEELDGHGRIPRMFFYQALRKLAIMVDDKEFIMAALKIPDNYHEHLNVSEWKTSKSLSCPISLKLVPVLNQGSLP